MKLCVSFLSDYFTHVVLILLLILCLIFNENIDMTPYYIFMPIECNKIDKYFIF